VSFSTISRGPIFIALESLKERDSDFKKKKKNFLGRDNGQKFSQFDENYKSTDSRRSTKLQKSQVLVAHVCNPSYSKGRDQED
jgi:hypothetical protein